MPGIAGFVAREQTSDLPDLLAKMIASLSRQDKYLIDKKIYTPQAGAASISHTGEEKFATQNGITLTVSGEITDGELLEFRQKLMTAGEQEAEHYGIASLFLALYKQYGARALCGLNGLYVVSIWNEHTQRLTIINDRYGLRKLYYWRANEGFFYASEYKAISRLPHFHRKVDAAGLSDLLTTGFMLDDRTLFEDIKILPGASILTYENGRCTIERYWDYQFDAAEGNRSSETKLVDAMAERLREAVRRRLAEDTCILITAGLDSRTIAALFQRTSDSQKVTAHSLGSETSRDVQVGRQFASQIGIPHRNIPIPPDYLDRYVLPCVWHTEANMNSEASWIFAERNAIAESNFQCLMTGIGGEVISGRQWIFETGEADIEKALQIYFNKNQFHLLKTLLIPSVYANVADAGVRSVRATIASAPTSDPLNKLDYLELQQDFRRHATSIDVFGDLVRVSDPLIDNDLVDFALTIPPRLRSRGYIYRKAIHKYLPEITDIADPSLMTRINPFQNLEILGYRKIIERISSKIRREIRHRQNSSGDLPSSNIQPNLWIRTVSKGFVTDILKRSDYLEDFFNMDAVSRILQDHMDGKRNAYRTITAILTFALWREAFCNAGFVYTEPVTYQQDGDRQDYPMSNPIINPTTP